MEMEFGKDMTVHLKGLQGEHEAHANPVGTA